MNQILIIVGIIGILLFLRWIRKQPKNKQIQGILALAAVVLIILAVTGRLHPLFAIIGAAAASFQKFVGLIRFIPLFKNLFANTSADNTETGNKTSNAAQDAKMTTEEAHRILGVDNSATEDEIRKYIQTVVAMTI